MTASRIASRLGGHIRQGVPMAQDALARPCQDVLHPASGSEHETHASKSVLPVLLGRQKHLCLVSAS